MTRRPLPSDQEVLFKNPDKLAEQSLIKPIKISQRSIKNFDISNHTYQNLDFADSEIYGLFIERSKLTHMTFNKGDYKGLFFTDSVLTDVHFDDVTITDLGFGRATLVDVTFQNCTLNAPVFAGAKGHLKFINCTLNAPEFRESQAILTFVNSTITNRGDPQTEVFTGLKLPAAIYLKDSHVLGESTSGPIVVGGTLTAFKANGGSIINVGIGDNIKDVELSHVTLEMSMRGNYDSITVDHSQLDRFGIGDTINHLSISDCTPSHRFALGRGTTVHSLQLSQCTFSEFAPHHSTISSMDIRQSVLGLFDLRESQLQTLTLNHVKLTNVDLANAHAEKVTADNLVFAPGGSLKDGGSNIKLH